MEDVESSPPKPTRPKAKTTKSKQRKKKKNPNSARSYTQELSNKAHEQLIYLKFERPIHASFGPTREEVSHRSNDWWRSEVRNKKLHPSQVGHKKTKWGGYTCSGDELPVFMPEGGRGNKLDFGVPSRYASSWEIRANARAALKSKPKRKAVSPVHLPPATKPLNHHAKRKPTARMADGDVMISAIKAGDLALVRSTIDSRGGSEQDQILEYTNRVDGHGRNALFYAAWYGYHSIVKELVAIGADVNKQSATGNTPAHIAVLRGHGSCAAVIVKNKKTNKELKNDAGQTWMECIPAEGCGRVAVVKIVGKKQEEIKEMDPRPFKGANGGLDDDDPLLMALLHGTGSKELQKKVVEASGAGDDALESLLAATDSEGNTLLHYAVYGGQYKAIKSLLELGSDPKAINKAGQTTLHIAADRGRASPLRLLCVETMEPSFKGKTAVTGYQDLSLMECVDKSADNPDSTEIVKLLTKLLTKRDMMLKDSERQAEKKARALEAERENKARAEAAKKKKLEEEKRRKEERERKEKERLLRQKDEEERLAAEKKEKEEAKARKEAELAAKKKKLLEEEERKKREQEEEEKKRQEAAEAARLKAEEDTKKRIEEEEERARKRKEEEEAEKKKKGEEETAAEEKAKNEAAEKTKATHDKTVHSIHAFFEGPGKHLLTDKSVPSEADVDKMLTKCNEDVKAVKQHLMQWSKMHRTFESIPALTDALAEAHELGLSASADTKRDIMKTCIEHDLLPAGFDATNAQIDQLCMAAGGERKVIGHLKQYGKFKRKFKNVDELAKALEHTNQNGTHIPVKELEKLGEFFTSDACTLFKGKETDPSVAISTKNVDRLYESQEPGFSVEHIKKFDKLNKEVFKDFEDFVNFIVNHDLSDDVLEVYSLFHHQQHDQLFSVEDFETEKMVRFKLKHKTAQHVLSQTKGKSPDEVKKILERLVKTGNQFENELEFIEAFERACAKGEFLHPKKVKQLHRHMKNTLDPNIELVSAHAEELLMICGDVGEVISHAKAFAALGIKFKSVQEMNKTFKEAVKTGVHVPKAKFDPFLKYMKSPAAGKIFKKPPKMNMEKIDAIFEMQGEEGQIWEFDDKEMQRWFDLGQSFETWDDFARIIAKTSITAMIKEGGRDQATDKIKMYMKKHHNSLFETKFKLSQEECLMLYLTCCSQETLFTVCNRYMRVKRVFKNAKELADAAIETLDTGLHVSMDVAQMILEVMSTSDFFDDIEGEMTLEVDDVDTIVVAGNGPDTTKQILQSLEDAEAKFSNVKELEEAIVEEAQGGHFYVGSLSKYFQTDEGRFVLKSPACDNISEDDCTKMIKEGKNISSLMTHLHRFAAVKVAFTDIPTMLAAIAVARQTGLHVDKTQGMKLLQRIADSTIFESDAQLDIDVDDIDHLCAVTGGIVQAEEYLEKSQKAGKKFRSVHDWVEDLDE